MGTVLDRIFWIRKVQVGVFGVVIFLSRSFLGGNCPGGNSLGGDCPGGSYPGWEFSRWEFSGLELSWVRTFLGRYFPGGNCLVGIIRVAVCQVGVFLVPSLSRHEQVCLMRLTFEK